MALEKYFNLRLSHRGNLVDHIVDSDEILSIELEQNATQKVSKILSLQKDDLIKEKFTKKNYIFPLRTFKNYRSFKSNMFSNIDKINDLFIDFSISNNETVDNNNNRIQNENQKFDNNGILNTFGYFTKLKNLYLKKCGLNLLQNQPFKSLSSLKSLNLSENLLQNIEHDSFTGLKLLNNLDLSQNKIKVIFSDKCFSDLEKLSSLNLEHNNIEKLEYDCFFGLDKLKELDLSFNKLKELTKQSFNGLKSLNSLKLTNNEITSILEDPLPILKLDKDFGLSLINLNFCGLENLTELNLSNNRLEKINKDFSNHLNNLKILNLSSNEIKYISSNAFTKMNSLQVLNLSSNKFEKLKNHFFNHLINLKLLRLNDNLIAEIENNTFSPLNNLVRLNLSFNKMTQINGEIFKNLINLKTLNLLSNNIGITLNASIFSNLVNLKHLDLRKNNINNIEDDAFNSLDELVSLRLSTNFKFSTYGSDQEDFSYFRDRGFLSSYEDNQTTHQVKQFENKIRIRLAIKRQIEYYMSKENLSHDEFLHRVMDRYGYVSLETMCDFYRMRYYRNEYFQTFPDGKNDDNNKRFDELVVDVISKSKHLELKFLQNENVTNILRNVRVKSVY